MAISLTNVRRGVDLKPPRILLYGPHGIGKTTFGAGAPAPILIPLEDGAGALDMPRFPLLTSYSQVLEALNSLGSEEHPYQTVVVDSLDWLEPMVWAEACRRKNWKDIEEPGYGKGYIVVNDVWREFFTFLQALRDYKSMQVILLAHCEIKAFQDPNSDPYDRYQIKLHKGASGIAQEWADAILFANFKSYVQKSKGAFNKETTRGVGIGERVMFSEERPAHYAKNRYALPYEMPLGYSHFAAGLARLMQPAPAAVQTTVSVPVSEPAAA